MRRILIVMLASLAVLSCEAAQDVAGRWTGRAQLPGRDLTLFVDLARDTSGAWVGSMTVPGFNVKGAALGHIRVAEDEIAFDAGTALGGAPDGPASFSARLEGRDAMRGEMRQAGNAAPFTLKRIGEAQVELPPKSTAVARGTEGRWIGEYEMGGYPRRVTVEIRNELDPRLRGGDCCPATVEFVVVGKATTKLPVDFVSEEEGLLRIEASAFRATYEGRVHKDEGRIDGIFFQGPIEVPLVLRREGPKS